MKRCYKRSRTVIPARTLQLIALQPKRRDLVLYFRAYSLALARLRLSRFAVPSSRKPSKRNSPRVYCGTDMLNEQERWALALSTFAGLSTTIGALVAIVRRPDDKLLAFLLGTAIGVMITLSILEMWIHNALEHGWIGVSGFLMFGAMIYLVAQPFLPDFQTIGEKESSSNSQPDPSQEHPKNGIKVAKLRSAELLRLGFLMAFTMTLHNLPEGFAVAFSAFTDVGPIMAAAIAVHNIPEGIVVAAPVYAATGSRWKALAIATISGLSEPVGALLALLSVKPLLSEDSLHYILAFAGGIMTAVCVVELWPEGRKCHADDKLVIGIVVGAIVMAWTLWVGV